MISLHADHALSLRVTCMKFGSSLDLVFTNLELSQEWVLHIIHAYSSQKGFSEQYK